MSSKNKIGRWKRFEIAFEASRNAAANSRQDWRRDAFGKTRELGEIEKESKGDRSSAEAAESARQGRPAPWDASPSLWAEARRRQAELEKLAKKRVESALKSEKLAELGRRNGRVSGKRSRAPRSVEPPRRFDDPRNA